MFDLQKINYIQIMKKLFLFIPLISCISLMAQKSDYYVLKTYHFSSADQGLKIMQYLENAYVPAMHSIGHETVGVFSLLANDTAEMKKIFVLVPGKDLDQLLSIEDELANHDMHLKSGMDYWSTAHDQPAYDRVETSLLKAFRFHQNFARPKLSAPMKERVYELRSYEGATEKLYRKKVEMFNEGGEIDIFDDLNFNAIFYSETLVGAHTPNLVYMTSFENMDDRNQHWDAFRNAPAWKELSAKEEYKNTVSHIDIFFLVPADFSDL